MGDLLYADTKFDPVYPGYINFTRQADGSVVLIVRGDPSIVNGSYVCGYTDNKGWPGRCTPGDAKCNNYCNSAPEKGPMQDHPLPCVQVLMGGEATIRLSAEEFDNLVRGLHANGPRTD